MDTWGKKITPNTYIYSHILTTEILEVNLFAFAYRLFNEDFSTIYGALLLNLFPDLYTIIW